MSEISELMLRDPLKLTREDRSLIIAKYREDRQKYLLGQKAPRAAKAPKGSIDLDSLDI